MKKFLIILIALAAVIGIYYWVNDGERPPTETGDDLGLAEYRDEDLSLSFKYPSGPEGYIVQEIDSPGTVSGLTKTIILMLASDYQSVISGEREGGEGPPAITIQAFNNPQNLSPRAWAEGNSQLSNWNLRRGDVNETEVAGMSAIMYEADGLYANRNAVFADRDTIYYVSGSYIDRDSALYRDFQKVIDSIEIE